MQVEMLNNEESEQSSFEEIEIPPAQPTPTLCAVEPVPAPPTAPAPPPVPTQCELSLTQLTQRSQLSSVPCSKVVRILFWSFLRVQLRSFIMYWDPTWKARLAFL